MRFWHIFKNELSYWLKERSTYIQFILIPLIMIFVLGSSLAGLDSFKKEDLSLPRVTLGVVNEGNPAMKEMLAQFVQAKEVREYVVMQEVEDEVSLEKQMRMRQVDNGMVISKEAGASIQLLQSTDEIINLMINTILNEFASVSAMQAFQSEHGKAIDLQRASGFVESDFKGPQVEMGLFSSQSVTSMQYYAVSILVMFLLYSGLRFGTALFVERSNYTLKRMLSTPARPYEIVYGLLLAHLILSLAQAGVIMLLTSWIYGVEWHIDLLSLVVVCTLLSLSSLCIGMMGAVWFDQSKTLHTFMQTIIVAMLAVSGGYVLIPDIQEAVGVYTLPYWGMQTFYNFMMDATSVSIQKGIGILAAWAFVLTMISLFFSKKVVSK